MPFEQLNFDIPERLSTGDFVLRPIVAADAEMDFEAVMESRNYLRNWEQSTWPEDDFTVEANREDLAKLERRHASQEAFTYTVLNPAGTECLGCVYFMPTDARSFTSAHITQMGYAEWSDFDAGVYFWVRESRLHTETDGRLLRALRTWLTEAWHFRRHLFITNEQFVQQVELFERAGLERRFEIAEPEKPGRYLAYEWD